MLRGPETGFKFQLTQNFGNIIEQRQAADRSRFLFEAVFNEVPDPKVNDSWGAAKMLIAEGAMIGVLKFIIYNPKPGEKEQLPYGRCRVNYHDVGGRGETDVVAAYIPSWLSDKQGAVEVLYQQMPLMVYNLADAIAGLHEDLNGRPWEPPRGVMSSMTIKPEQYWRMDLSEGPRRMMVEQSGGKWLYEEKFDRVRIKRMSRIRIEDL